jgi:uncharacterized protein (TIGR03083 family)
LTISEVGDKLSPMNERSVSETDDAFFAACGLALEVVGAAPVAQAWEAPSAVEGYTVGALAAHVYAAILLFESAVEKPEPHGARLLTLTDFYSLNRVEDRSEIESEFNQAIRADAVRRAEGGPAEVVALFTALVGRLRTTLVDLPSDRLVPVWRVQDGATRLSDYLLTRIVELVVHADDLAASVDLPMEIPPDVASATFAAFLQMARVRSGDVSVLRAFTRRERGDPEDLRVL